MNSMTTLLFVFSSLLVFSLHSTVTADPVSVEEPEDSSASASGSGESVPCNIHDNEALHAVMDRVCELCHDMYSHQIPNLRSRCRSKCFQSEQFKKCLHLFKPARSLRHKQARD